MFFGMINKSAIAPSAGHFLRDQTIRTLAANDIPLRDYYRRHLSKQLSAHDVAGANLH